MLLSTWVFCLLGINKFSQPKIFNIFYISCPNLSNALEYYSVLFQLNFFAIPCPKYCANII